MAETSIEWCDVVWNCVRGCSRVSPGCGGTAGEGGCYAERQAYRFAGPGMPYEGLVRLGKQGPRWTGAVRLVPEMLADPLSWRRPRRVFVNSMSDLFHEGLTNEQIAAVFGVMTASPQQTFQVLTKRARRMREWFEWAAVAGQESRDTPSEMCRARALGLLSPRSKNNPAFARTLTALCGYDKRWPLPNLWIGVSVEDQQRADERIPELLRTPAAVRFVSAEPLLGPVDLEAYLHERRWDTTMLLGGAEDVRVPGLDWVIVGSESGPRARPMETAWARRIVDDCVATGVSVFTKQIATPGHPKGGDPQFWPSGIWPREFPEFPEEVGHAS